MQIRCSYRTSIEARGLARSFSVTGGGPQSSSTLRLASPTESWRPSESARRHSSFSDRRQVP